MKIIKLTLWLFFTLAIVALVSSLYLQNNQLVSLKLFDFESQALPIWIFALIAFATGALFSALFFIVELGLLELKFMRLKRTHNKLIKSTSPKTTSTSIALPEDPKALQNDD